MTIIKEARKKANDRTNIKENKETPYLMFVDQKFPSWANNFWQLPP
jgi:hypothetical protein